MVSTDRNVSDLTTKHHHEDRLAVLMSLGRLGFARGHGDAVLAANEGPDRRSECGGGEQGEHDPLSLTKTS